MITTQPSLIGNPDWVGQVLNLIYRRPTVRSNASGIDI